MPSQSNVRFNGNKKYIEILWHIHAEVAGNGKGRKYRADILNRATMVFIAACWESYIEDLAIEAFDFLLEQATTPDVFPAKVRTIAARTLREDKDERKIWELAGNGWRTLLESHRDTIHAKWLKDFNTPKSAQVNELFLSLIDVPNVTNNWTWIDMSYQIGWNSYHLTILGHQWKRVRPRTCCVSDARVSHRVP